MTKSARPTPDRDYLVPIHCSECGKVAGHCNPPAPPCRVLCRDCASVQR